MKSFPCFLILSLIKSFVYYFLPCYNNKKDILKGVFTMNFYLPTRIFDEKGCVLSHAGELSLLGKNALLVTGKHSSRTNSSLSHVCLALDKYQIPYTLFDEIEPNPSVETIMKAAKAGIQAGSDFVIGIGGGSPLDAAKAIALMIANPDCSEEILYQKKSLPHLPVACVPTTAGTGSEVTPYAILTLHEEKTKRSISHTIFPAYALCDASYLETAPEATLIHTAVDALAHLIESQLNSKTSLYSQIFSEKGLALWGSIKKELQKKPLEKGCLPDSVYQTLMQASTLGGMAISHTGTSLPHGLSYPITYRLSLPHGKAVGLFLGGFVENYPDKAASGQVLSLLGFSDAKEFSSYLSDILELSSLSIPEELMETSFHEVLSNPAKLKNYPYKADYELMKKIGKR